MTQNLVSNKNAIKNRMSKNFIEPQKTPRAPRDMWKSPDEDKKDDSDEEKKKRKEERRYKTIVTHKQEMDVFETEDLDSDEESSEESDDSLDKSALD